MSKVTTAANRTPVLKGSGIKVSDLDANIAAALTEAHDKDKGLRGADIARALGVKGLTLRTFIRSHGGYVGQGRTYGYTVAEAKVIAVAFLNGVAPSEVYRKGEVVAA